MSAASGVPLTTASDVLARIDPVKLRRAIALAERVLRKPRAGSDWEAMRSEIAALTYEWLDKREKQGQPVNDDAEIVSLVNPFLRRFRELVNKPG